MTKASKLSRRERQIMDIIYRLEGPSVKEVMENLEDAPSYSTVRALLRNLVDKGHLSHRASGLKYVYYPLVEREAASASALSNLVKTFFSDSPALAVNSLLDMSSASISDEELLQLEKLIKEKKKLNKKSNKKSIKQPKG
ncbi:MAG: BlaI/MecI/CopY family transcriptional regulator [Proteobacteria bacterium]|nr:BlaI/MecI/CopY family transcriptional regulator [Pseudomonadota bacterium]